MKVIDKIIIVAIVFTTVVAGMVTPGLAKISAQNSIVDVNSLLPSSVAENDIPNTYEYSQSSITDNMIVFTEEFVKEELNGFIIQLDKSLNNLDDVFVKIYFETDSTENLKFEEEDIQKDYEGESKSSLTSSIVYTFTKKIVKVEVGNTSGEVSLIPVRTTLDQRYGVASVNEFTQAKKDTYRNLGFNIVTREEWGAPQESAWLPGKATTVSKIVVHHTAGGVNNSDPASEVRRVYNMHYFRCADNSGSYNPNNPQPNCDEPAEWWEDVGYNFIVDQFGTIYEGRAGGIGVTGAHSPPNSGTIGISLLGNFVNAYPTKEAIDSLRLLLAGLSNLYSLQPKWGHNSDSTVTVTGHYTRQSTACPGARLISILPIITSDASIIRDFNGVWVNPVKNKVNSMGIQLTSEAVTEQIVLQKENLSPGKIDFIKRYIVNTSDYSENSEYIFFNIDKRWTRSILLHSYLLDNNLKMQPNRVYEIGAWNKSGDRSTPDNYDISTLWNLEQTKAPEAWDRLGGCTADSNCGGSQIITIAVIDSGVAYEDYSLDAGGTYQNELFLNTDLDYPTTAANGVYNEGFDRIYNKSPIFTNTNFVSPYNSAQEYVCLLRSFSSDSAKHCNAIETANIDHANDDNGHGTFVAGIIAANPDLPLDSKLTGIAFNTSIMPIKAMLPNYTTVRNIFGNIIGGSTNSLILASSIEYAVDNGADVINLSLSGFGSDPMVDNAIKYAVDRNVVIVAASGNNNANASNYFPGNSANVITVGASNSAQQRAEYSNFGSKIDLVAPVGSSLASEQIASQWFNCNTASDCEERTVDNFVSSNLTSVSNPSTALGTSFAAPQVSSAVALMKSVNPNLTPEMIRFYLHKTATDIMSVGRDDLTGYGNLNLDSAVKIASEYTNPKYVYRFYNARTGAHFYTNNVQERNDVINRLPQFGYEGHAYLINDQAMSDTVPLYRFYNARTGTHFYTNSLDERNDVINRLPQFIYEGIGYYVLSEGSEFGRPVYRFYNTSTGSHFYTSSPEERDDVRNRFRQFVYEGIRFYVL